MNKKITKIITASILSLDIQDQNLAEDLNVEVTQTKDLSHGDFSCSVAMRLSKVLKLPPLDIAKKIINTIEIIDGIERIEAVPPGFINIFLTKSEKTQVLKKILKENNDFATEIPGSKNSVLLEFVSSNPTGPLHVGHGRHAAFGDSLAKLLRKAGHKVETEYYINDAGRQIDILLISILIRALNKLEIKSALPRACYQGEYLNPIADQIIKQSKNLLTSLPVNNFLKQDVSEDVEIDLAILSIKNEIGDEMFESLSGEICNITINMIKEDLNTFGVNFDHWYSERSMINNGLINNSINDLKKLNLLYKQEGALWLKTTNFNDDKDRVVLRDDGRSTYFASDIAYHADKKKRGYDQLINILGSDHHGYIGRLKAGLSSLNFSPEDLEVVLVQFVSLYRGKKKIQMSTRSGEFIPMSELYNEVGVDAARFFYVSKSQSQHLEFDLELAKQTNNENPVYYIQYAHARICRVLTQMTSQTMSFEKEIAEKNLDKLTTKHEVELIAKLSGYSALIKQSAHNKTIHTLANYLHELAQLFHSYYGAETFLIADKELRNARVLLIQAVKIILKNGLSIIGVSAPSKM